MATLAFMERQTLEKFLQMGGGYVLDFSDRTFQEFVADAVRLDIHDSKYSRNGTSKANKLRQFWSVENDHTVGSLLSALIDFREQSARRREEELPELQECRAIAARLLSGGPRPSQLEEHATTYDAHYLKRQIQRMEAAIDTDPELAIGTAKELIETCCHTILEERGEEINGTPDLPSLTKQVLKALDLVPQDIADRGRGAETIKRVVQGMASSLHGLAELRNLYGTGHGKSGRASGLSARHARLAVGASVSIAGFLFESHQADQ